MSAREYLTNCYRIKPTLRKKRVTRCVKVPDDFVTASDQGLMPPVRKWSMKKVFNEDTDFIPKEEFLTNKYANVWDHASRILEKIISEGPDNVIDNFEFLSRFVKIEAMHRREDEDTVPEPIAVCREDRLSDTDELVQIPPAPYQVELLREEKKLAIIKSIGFEDENGYVPLEDDTKVYFNISEQMTIFEEVGIGLPKHEVYEIGVSMQKLVSSQPITKIRFWGKIFGYLRDYLVVECELTEEEYARRRQEDETASIDNRDLEREDRISGRLSKFESWKPKTIVKENMTEEELKMAIFREKTAIASFRPPPLPRPEPLIRQRIPPEISGEGCNKKVYFVCNDPIDSWHMLPNVKPKHIAAARLVSYQFSGALSKDLGKWANFFPGLEAEYLRAQIARISAGTQISPAGFYKFQGEGEEEEEEEEEEEGEEGGGSKKKDVEENKDYIPLPFRDQMDPTMAFWVHHTPHILKQGRVVFWQEEMPKPEGEEEEDEGEGEEKNVEKGPSLMSPLSQDTSKEVTHPWCVRTSTQRIPHLAVIVVRSNVWPGAYAYSTGRKSDTIYMGTGEKFKSGGLSPPLFDWCVHCQYPIGPDILEAFEPTLEMEMEWWRKQEEKKMVKAPDDRGEGEGEGGPKGEDEEEEEEEDDD